MSKEPIWKTKPYRCDECNVNYRTHDEIIDHEREHHPDSLTAKASLKSDESYDERARENYDKLMRDISPGEKFWLDVMSVRISFTRMDNAYVAYYERMPYPRGYGRTRTEALRNLEEDMNPLIEAHRERMTNK